MFWLSHPFLTCLPPSPLQNDCFSMKGIVIVCQNNTNTPTLIVLPTGQSFSYAGYEDRVIAPF